MSRHSCVLLGAAILMLTLSIGISGARPGVGGGGARPAPHPAPAPRPAPHPSFSPRPAPQPAARPAPRPSNPGINPGIRPATPPQFHPNPNPGQAIRPPQPTPRPTPTPLPGPRPDIKFPGNANRPNLPDRPAIRPPGGDIRPDRPIPKNLPYPPNAKGNLPDFQKKLPDLFPGPRPGGGGGGIGPINPGHPTGGDVAKWIGRPGAGGGGEQWNPSFRPGAGGGGEQWARPSPQVRQNFQSNYATAIQRNVNNNNFIRTGGRVTNINLARNNHYTALVNHAGIVNTRLRTNYNTWFRPNWWSGHRPGNLPYWSYHYYNRPASWWWRPAVWTSAIAWMPAYSFAPPIYYDYAATGAIGATDLTTGASPVVIQDDVTYVNDQPVCAAPVYAQQALDLATVDAPPPEGTQIEWLPLGTFAMASRPDDNDPGVVIQLALSKDGLVSGSWYDRQTDTNDAVEGRVDPQTQRIAVRKVGQPDVVLEVGLYNLTQPATTALLHFGTLQSQVRYLTRLDAPADADDPNAPSGPPPGQ